MQIPGPPPGESDSVGSEQGSGNALLTSTCLSQSVLTRAGGERALTRGKGREARPWSLGPLPPIGLSRVQSAELIPQGPMPR